MAASPSSVAATSDVDIADSPSFAEGVAWGSADNADRSSKHRKSIPKEEHIFGKIRHLKKDDGEPLWREDIQHDFLRAIFDDEQKVFTNSYEKDMPKQCFADLYIDTMSRSSKTSRVLRDKLLSDREAAKGMAMVCLLVNINRMNTTLNFFPEMRAQLRTYHAIPSLQAQQDPRAYKQLQDAPRLKSILKGGAEDRKEPATIYALKALEDIPRTNPVNLIFVMCNGAAKMAELHFPPELEFHDLIMKTHYSSKSRAAAFLWLMWQYLESDFTEEGCEENPFGPGVDYGLDVANQGVPRLVELTEEEKALENVDTPEEIDFGREKQKARAKILEMDNAYLHERENKRGKTTRTPLVDEGPAILPRIRPSKHESDIDSTRSTPPPKTARNAGGSSRRAVQLKYQIFEGSSPAHPATEGVSARKPRPPTAHQLAVERNRNQRIEYILDRGMRKVHRKSRKLRKRDGAIFLTYKRLEDDLHPYNNSDDETPETVHHEAGKEGRYREVGTRGLCLLMSEPDDYGEEAGAYAAALRRSMRRLSRWHGKEKELGVIAPIKRPRVAKERRASEEAKDIGDDTEMGTMYANGDMTEDITMGGIEPDEVDQTMMADDEGRPDEDGDDADKTEVMGDSDLD